MKNLYLFILFISLSGEVFPQQTTFSNVHVSQLKETSIRGYSMVPMSDRGYLTVGDFNEKDGFMMKSDSAGNVLWNRVISDTNHPGDYMRFNSIISTFDSAAFIVGKTYSNERSKELGILLKVDNYGNIEWIKSLETTHNLHLTAACQTGDSGFMITGYSYYTSDLYHSQPFIARLTKEGNLLWSKSFEADINYKGSSVKPVNDTSFIIAGYSWDSDKSFLLKFSNNGNVYWAENVHLGNNNSCSLGDVVVLNNGFLIKANLFGQASLIKTDVEGNILWSRSYMRDYWTPFDFEANSRLYNAADNGFVFVFGYSHGNGILFRTDSVGALLYSRELQIGVKDVAETAHGEYFVMGIGPVYEEKMKNYFDDEIGFMQLDSLGNNANCIVSYAIPPHDTTFSLFTEAVNFTPADTSILTAFEAKIDSTPIMSRPGCVDVVGAVKTHNDHTEVSVFPNPSGGIFTFEVKSGGKGRIVIYNSLGVPLMNVLSVNRKTSIDLSDKQPGIYFYKFTDKYGKTAKGKIIIR